MLLYWDKIYYNKSGTVKMHSCLCIQIWTYLWNSNRIKRGNGEHIQDTTLRPEMETATQGHPMVFNER